MGKSLPRLYLHVGQATHFLRWEIPEFNKYFTLVDSPSKDIPLLCFGPDVLEEAAKLPASKRYAVLFPGFAHNPVYNPDIKKLHRRLIASRFSAVFINPGPLEIAYKGLENVLFYPFSIDTELVQVKNFRKNINSLLHVSSESPQKDWQRSEAVMQRTGLEYEVYPPRSAELHKRQYRTNKSLDKVRRILGMQPKNIPYGYVKHELVVKKYQQYDGFVHVAKDIKDPIYIDGKYTASFIEAGMTGAILFWHDTFKLGNNLKTVFNLSLDPEKAAKEILEIRSSIDVEKHSQLTRQEMLDTFNPVESVRIRAEKILQEL